MPKLPSLRPNALGDLRAEADTTMLARAFLETADYRTLIETSDRPIVVGRRGTGKSALARQLHHFFYREGNTVVISISPEEDQTIGLRARLAHFGTPFLKARAAARLLWRYALMMEAANALTSHYKFRNTNHLQTLRPYLETWLAAGKDTDRN